MVNKEILKERLAEKVGGSKKLAGEYIDGLWEVVEDLLVEGEHKIAFTGFAAIEVVPTKERKMFNIHTKQEDVIPAGKRIKFTAGKYLKDAIK